MNETCGDLFLIIKRFPDKEEILKTLFKKSNDFRSICEDYRKCREALTFWTLSEARESSAHRKEYLALLMELEEEIISYLDENQW